MAQVPVVRVTVRLGPDSTAGTSTDALKKGLEQYLHAHNSGIRLVSWAMLMLWFSSFGMPGESNTKCKVCVIAGTAGTIVAIGWRCCTHAPSLMSVHIAATI